MIDTDNKETHAEVAEKVGTGSQSQHSSGAFENKDRCSLCRKGGDLLCCDRCPRVYHLKCLKLKPSEVPEDDWFCPKCM
jgi:hypothetical protein